MLTLLILLVLTAVFAWITAIIVKKDLKNMVWETIFAALSILSGVTLFTLLILIIPARLDFKYQESQYEIVKEILVEYNNENSDKDTFEGDLREGVFETNRMIAKHRILSHNPFTNIWFSKDVGNLKPLSINYGKNK